MGLIRKMASVSTLGGVKYTSRREAETKERLANARLARTQAQQAKPSRAEKWEPSPRRPPPRGRRSILG